jgi:putative transposase
MRPCEASTITRSIHFLHPNFFVRLGIPFLRPGGVEVCDARRLKALDDENAKLKKLLAEAMLERAMVKDIASKKW